MKKTYREVILILDYLRSKSARPAWIDRMKAAVRGAYDKNDVKGIKQIARDMRAWVASLEKEDRMAIEQLVGKLPEVPPEVIDIVARASIMDVTEYRILHDAVSDYDLPPDLVATIGDMMNAYKGPVE